MSSTSSSTSRSSSEARPSHQFSIIESTLREGEQFATAFFDTETKLKIAKELDNFGVDYIEVTNPAASEQSRSDCKAICSLGLKRSKVLAHVRCHMNDARIAIESGVDGVNVLIGTSPQLRKHSHGKSMPEITEMAKEVLDYLMASGLEVRFSAEDAFRSDQDELLALYKVADGLGVHRVGVADTVGCATPDQVYNFISRLRKTVNCGIEVHFHNDTSCAVANAFSAIEAGATHIDTTVLGIGERNGITSLGGLMARMIVNDREYILSKYQVSHLKALEQLVGQAAGVSIPFCAPITGSAAFSHKAGIHTKAVLNDPNSYEVIHPEDFGLDRNIQFASRLTGWNSIKARGEQLGVQMTDAQFRECTELVKAAGDKGCIKTEDVDRIILEFQKSALFKQIGEMAKDAPAMVRPGAARRASSRPLFYRQLSNAVVALA